MTRTSQQAPSGTQFRRAALVAGAVAIVALTTNFVLPDMDQYLLVPLVAVIAAFLTTHLLVRMWKAEDFVGSRRAVPGRRLAAGFELLLASAIVVNLIGLPGFAVVSGILATGALLAFLAALALAIPRP